MQTFKKWFLHNEAENNTIEAVLNKYQLVLFFEVRHEVYGTDEDNRVIFAKMKNPDEDLPKNWDDEASFTAHNLKKLLRGESSYHLFNKEVIKQLKVIDKEKVIEKLRKEADSFRKQPVEARLVIEPRRDIDQSPNFVRADED